MKSAWGAVVVSILMALSTGLLALLVFTWPDSGDSFERAFARESGDLVRPAYEGDSDEVSADAPARGRWM